MTEQASEDGSQKQALTAIGKMRPRSSRDVINMVAMYALLWALCVASILFLHYVRDTKPSWLGENFELLCSDSPESQRPGKEWRAETDIYAEDDFCFYVYDRGVKRRVLPLKTLTEGDMAAQEHAGAVQIEVESAELENAGSVQPEADIVEPENAEPERGVTYIAPYDVSVHGTMKAMLEGNVEELPGSSDYVYFVRADVPFVRKGELIYDTDTANKRVRYLAFYKIQAYLEYSASLQRDDSSLSWVIPGAVYSCILLLIFGTVLVFMRGDLYNDLRQLSLCGLCLVVQIVLMTLIQWIQPKVVPGSFLYLCVALPLGLAPALISYLLGRRVGMCCAVLLSCLAPIIISCQWNYALFLYSLLVTLTAVLAFVHLQKRIQYLLGLFELFLVICGSTAMFCWLGNMGWVWHDWNFWSTILLLAFFNVSMILLAMLILPCFLEPLFDVTTNYTLNDLNSRDHKLLERLRKEAPGTYEHSLAVAHIARDAAEAIGANPKLAEACANFHDIGKLFSPEYFAENLMTGEANPHDSITPKESCNYLREHVEFGLQLARDAHLPVVLRAAIEQHHGNGLMAGFYNKALKEATEKGEAIPLKREYSYHGSTPAGKEVAIISIADACEAAVRAIARNASVDGAQIYQKVHEIVLGKYQGAQLDSALLTLADLKMVEDAIVETLCVIHHKRPEYPDDKTQVSR